MKEEILKLRKEGKTYNEISKILSCAKSTISYHCKNETKSNLIILKDDYDIVLKLRFSGYTYTNIKNETNLTLDKIRKICRNNNLNNNKCIKYKHQTKYSIEEINKMQLFYNDCNSVRKTAKYFNTTRYQILSNLNINKKEKLDDKILKQNKVKSVSKWRNDKKEKLVKYKGGCCEICGYSKCLDALEFHHKEPNKKDFTVAGKTYSYDKLKNEVDKCILVCSNCHKEIHYNQKMNKNNKEV